MGKNISKKLSSKYNQKLFDHANHLLQMHLKMLQKGQFEKLQKKKVFLLVIKLLMKLEKCRELQHIIIWKLVEMKQKVLNIIEKYLKKNIYLPKKDRKLLII